PDRRPPRSSPFPYTTLFRSLGGQERVVERVHVLLVLRAAVGPVHGLHVPPVRLVAPRDVLAERDRGVVLDRDVVVVVEDGEVTEDRKSTRLNSSHVSISYAV